MATQLMGSLHGIYVAGVRALPMVLKSGEGTGTGISALTDSMVSGLQDISGELMTALGKIVPIVLVVVGGVSVVVFGVKLFRKFAK